MTDDSTDALEQALALHATPGRLPLLRERPLPGAVLSLIRIAAGDREAIGTAVARTAETAQIVADAAVLYIQQVLFHENADSYRLLGVRADASDETIKEHYRWLTRWLHPDRHPERWEVVYSERVNRAWKTLGSEQRRSEYDAQALTLATDWDANAQIAPMRISKRLSAVSAAQPVLSPRTIRRLPMLVLGGLAIVAALSLVLLYWVQYDRRAAHNAAPEKISTTNPADATSAQDAVIRRSLAFDEHVIELSQPVAPAKIPVLPRVATEQATPVAPLFTAAIPAVLTVATPSKPPATVPVAVSAAVPVAVAAQPAPVAPRTMSDNKLVQVPVHAVAMAAQSAVVAKPTPPTASVMTPSTARARRSAQSSPTASASTPTPIPDSVASGGISAQEAASALPREFAGAYAKGDLAGMMRLFTPNAVDNRGGIEAIAEDYDSLFNDSSSRELRLDALEWSVQAERIVGSGTFEARIRHKDAVFAKRVQGWIQIEAVPINGRWKIQRILHRNTE